MTSFGYDKAATGGGIYTSAVLRRSSAGDYRAQLRVTTTATTLNLLRTGNGVETTIASQVVPGLAMAPGDVANLRFQAEGAGTTALRAKVWKNGAAEPGTWTVTGSDATAALQAAGAVGLSSYLSGSATNAPIVLDLRDFRVRRLT